MLLAVSNVEKAFGPLLVLSNVSFSLHAGDRAGMVGANGAGKSTLLRIAAGDLPADDGKVALGPGAIAAYLPQQPPEPPPGTTLDELLYDAVGGLRAMEHRLRELEATLAEPGAAPGSIAAAMDEYGELQERFDRRGGYDFDARIDQVFAGLGIAHLPRGRAFETFSGGEKVRALLASLLLCSPDVLLLDEPTNHLDAAASGWLEGYLAGFRGAVLAVSHDRRFLDAVATRIIEVDEHSHGLREYAGNYQAYATARAAERERWAADYARQQDEIAELRRAVRVEARQLGNPGRAPRDNDKFARHFFGGRQQAAIARNVRSAEERLRRIEADPIPRPPEQLTIAPEFDVQPLEGHAALRVEGVSKAYGGRMVLRDVSFELGPRVRVVITGPNGVGKSTLLDLLAGRQAPDAGQVRWAPGARIGYLDQDARDLDPAATVLDAYRAGLTGYQDELIRDLLRYGLFGIDDLRTPVGLLSTGERRKLELARLVATRANLLLLDEPTNHLAFDILQEFERALGGFAGPVIAVSHDRWFIERFGGAVWSLEAGQLATTPG
ncbi:MAG: ABC-F family ATP-binding cassette domain-containing protein [Dehalococcoidia bacterium]|nr:ABC-F family ATP-binding cassette domain-containing protein [Dehalococcoidia bacterium]